MSTRWHQGFAQPQAPQLVPGPLAAHINCPLVHHGSAAAVGAVLVPDFPAPAPQGCCLCSVVVSHHILPAVEAVCGFLLEMGSFWRAGIYFKALSLSVFPAVPGTGPWGCTVELTSAGDLWAHCRPPWSSPSVCFCLEECVFLPAAYMICWMGWGFCVYRLYNFIDFKLLPDQPFSLTSEAVIEIFPGMGLPCGSARGVGSGTSVRARQQMAMEFSGCVPCR